MTTLAPKLPYDHPFAGGYPRVGGQPLPTDPDAIDYLNRVAAADGAAVEVGVAMAVDAFVRGCKADGIWDALKASCIMCGARTVAGALVPLVGVAPTPYNFAGGDYDRTTGLKGDGATKYLDSNRANNADGQDDFHLSGYTAAFSGPYFIAAGASNTGTSMLGSTLRSRTGTAFDTRSISNGFTGHSRSNAGSYTLRTGGVNEEIAKTSETPASLSLLVFARGTAGSPASFTSMPIAFYSIGSSLNLAALDNRVSTLVAAIAAVL